jgi:P27 family predicted phage terminase small subunit
MKKSNSFKSSLCPEAQSFLDNIYELLNEQEVLTSLDDATMNLIGATYNNYIEATKILQEKGLLITSPRGEIKAHPAVKIQLDAQIQLDKLLDKFGMNPKSRKEISKPKERAGELSPIDVFLTSTKKK